MIHSPPLFALGFSQLWMLGWLAAAAVPIVIHLWNQRRYREVTWAAMEYLLAALQKNARRLRIEQWLLLAIRTAIILLVVLAVAGPYLEQAAAPFITGRPTHKLIVLDGSYSMAYRSTDKSRFDRAVELVTEIVEQSREGDAFTLILMASPPRVIVGTPSFSRRDFLLELQNLKLQHTGGELSPTLAQVQDVLTTAAHEASRLVQHEVYFVTDLGRTTWQAAATSADEARAKLDQIAELAKVWLVDLGQPQTENFAISGLRSNQALFTTAEEIDFETTVKSFATQPQRRKVEFIVDGQRMSEETVEVPAAGEAALSFRHRFEAAGDHTIEARLTDDALPVDDHRWLSFPVKEAVETLIVNGESNPRAANYLRFALDPDSGRGETAAHRTVRTSVIAETALLEMDLSRFDCIFFSNVGQFTRGEAQVLGAYLKGGGGLVFFLGDRVLADRYNQELGGAEGSNRLLPVVLDEPVSGTSYWFGPLEYKHPIVTVFRGNEDAGLLQTPIFKYFRMRLFDAKNSTAEVALQFLPTEDPAIVTEQIYRGRVTVVALPASLESVDRQSKAPWSVMTATPSFQPIVQEILAWTLRGQNQERNTLVGEPVGAAAPLAAADTSIALSTPDGRHEQVRVAAERDQTRWSFGDTWWSGIYEAELPISGTTNQLFAVNLDTGESDLAKVALDELPESVTPLGQWQDLEESSSVALAARGGVHRPLLYAALALLLIESCLAWYLGYRAS
ncbi:MAG: BatA domain-containing protein [Pirellulales bacterium]